MMILCQGPDTFRAMHKAQDLERAFREKYDPAGYAIERLPAGKEIWKEVQQRASAVGLFASHKFLRADGLWRSCPKKEREKLKQALSVDPERVIVVSLEEELTSEDIQELTNWQKVVRYEFPLLRGTGQQEFANRLASELGLGANDQVTKIAQQTEGDSWLLWNELTKFAAAGIANSSIATEDLTSIFAHSDRYFFQTKQAYLFQEGLDAAAALPVFLQQGRVGLRVVGGYSEGVPAFVARKWQSVKQSAVPELKIRVARLVQATYLQRRGIAGEGDLDTLL